MGEYLSIPEAAAILGIHVNTLRGRVQEIGGIFVGRQWIVPAERLSDFVVLPPHRPRRHGRGLREKGPQYGSKK